MDNFLLDIANIAGGILLGLATLDKLDGESNFFNKIAGTLAPFQTVIGGSLVFLAIWIFWDGLLYNLVSLAGGLLLLTHVFGKIPSLESSLRKLSDKLMPFKATIGVALVVIGVLSILNFIR